MRQQYLVCHNFADNLLAFWQTAQPRSYRLRGRSNILRILNLVVLGFNPVISVSSFFDLY